MATVVGFSPLSAPETLAHAMQGEFVGGDWIAADETTVVSSPVAAVPYFVAEREGALVHGSDLFDLARELGEPWRWNHEAIRSLAAFGHTVELQTLHERIFRMPSDTTASVVDGRLVFEPRGFWSTAPSNTSVAEVATLTQTLTAGFCEKPPLISLSAGHDSRLLLAAALASGVTPRLAVMGTRASADRRAAELLADTVGAELHVVELDAESYVAAGPAVARLTGGAKLASNWHTYLYAVALGGHDGAHLVGSNGEFARTFYLKGKSWSPAANVLPSREALTLYFALRGWVLRDRYGALTSGRKGQFAFARRLANSQPRRPNTLNAFDEWYATQRVRHLIGDGMALYRSQSNAVSPFLDARWVRAVRGLPRASRLHNRFHEEATNVLAPQLAAVPYGGIDHESYSPWRDAIARDDTRQAVVEGPELDELWPRAERRTAAQNIWALDILVTLHAAIVARELSRHGRLPD